MGRHRSVGWPAGNTRGGARVQAISNPRSDRLSPMLDVGHPLPDLKLPGPDGKPVRLRDLAAGKVLVIYFYPKDDTPGCTAQACGFRDAYEDFVEAGAEVVGISQDPPASHRAFAQKHRLPFLLLSDPEGQAQRAFGVKKT